MADADAVLRQEAMQRVLFVVQANVQRRTRVRTGHLRRSWATRVEAAGARGVVGTTVLYARYQRNDPLVEGLDDSRPEIDRILAQAGARYAGALASEIVRR